MKTRRVNKNFIEKELIPFVLREQGRGFEMSLWRRDIKYLSYYFSVDVDDVVAVPACNTVACLGGSVEFILRKKGLGNSDAEIANAMGLTEKEADGLFWNWDTTRSSHYRWPRKHAQAFAKAKTKLAKAKVAVSLLRRIVKTDAKCLKARVFVTENLV